MRPPLLAGHGEASPEFALPTEQSKRSPVPRIGGWNAHIEKKNLGLAARNSVLAASKAMTNALALPRFSPSAASSSPSSEEEGISVDSEASFETSDVAAQLRPPPRLKYPNAFEIQASQFSNRRASEKRRLIQMIRSGSVKIEHNTKSRARFFLVSVQWQIMLCSLFLIEIAIHVVRFNVIFKGYDPEDIHIAVLIKRFQQFWKNHPYAHIVWTFAVAFVYGLDVCMRVRAVGARSYFRKPMFVFDFLLAMLTVGGVGTLLGACYHHDDCVSSHSLFPMMQALRFLRFVQVIKMMPYFKMLRYAVSGSKRRFVDWIEELDLDLTYVTEHLIAMSVPATGARQCFRNPMPEVARFFETFHPKRYLILNCCPELPYDTSLFRTGKVVKFDIQDHMPPTMPQFVECIRVVLDWMGRHPDNIVAVHCKGGKGRTGSFVTAWLLYSQKCDTVDDALNTFALARTDIVRGATLQGVETPSQVRYLDQFNRLVTRTPADTHLELPALRDVSFSEFSLRDVYIQEPPEEMQVALHKVVSGSQSFVVAWSDVFGPEATRIPLGNVRVAGDLRVSVFDHKRLERARAKNPCGVAFSGDCRNPLGEAPPSNWGSMHFGMTPKKAAGKRCLAGQEPGCLYYFIVHTAFLDDIGELQIKVCGDGHAGGLDKAWKQKRKYNRDGHVALHYRKL